MANYLVTGGGGFIGSHIVEHLLETGESVRVLDNFSTGSRDNLSGMLDRIDLIEGDLRNPEDCTRAVADMDYVLHQGAISSVPRSLANPILSHEANITGTLNLLIAARDAKVRRLVFASSSSVYGEQESASKSEDLRLNPLSPYAATKAAGEHYIAAFGHCFGLETIGLRYFNVFGPRQDANSQYSAVIPRFIVAALENRSPTIHGDGLQARDFTFVANNVRATMLAATVTLAARGQIYNIACGESHTLIELLQAVNEILGSNVKPNHTQPRPGDVRISKADIQRARKDLGYEPLVLFREGLRRTIEWYCHARKSMRAHGSV